MSIIGEIGLLLIGLAMLVGAISMVVVIVDGIRRNWEHY